MKKFSLLAGLCMACLVISCKNATAPNAEKISELQEQKSINKNAGVPAENETLDQSPKQLAPPKQNQTSQTPFPIAADWDKKIVRNANITIQVKDIRASAVHIKDAVKLNGGFVANSNEQQLNNEIRVEMTIRVPRERFDNLLESIQSGADSLLAKNITSEDLTEEWVDVQSRIKAKQKVRERYYEFLKKAGTVKDVLAIEADLRVLDEEIESATGRVNYIQHQSELSEIHLVYFQPLPFTIQPYEKPAFFAEVAESAARGWNFIRELLVALIALWPIAVILPLLVLLFKKRKKSAVA